MHPVTQYATEVVHGEKRAQCCKWEILACERHLKDLERQGTEDFPYVFDPTRADRIYRHFANIPRLDAPGSTIELEDWQQFDDGCIFGWVHRETGKRRFTTAYRRVARGHAKTTCAAGVGLYFMTGDALYPPGKPELAQYEVEPEVVICAVDREQAKRCLEDIRTFGGTSPAMSKRLLIRRTYIKHRKRGGQVIALSKDTKNKDGGRPSVIITEEWHAHTDGKVHNVAVSGKGKKWQCLEYIITTAGTDAENKPCYRDDLFYKQVLSGSVKQDDVFIMIREIDDKDDPHDTNCWVKSNPFFRNGSAYARTLWEEVKSQHDVAYNSGDADKIREFLIKRMNRWQADAANKYMSGHMDKLRACKVSLEEFARLTKGTKGHVGVDLGKTLDLSAVAYVSQLEDMRIAIAAHGFMPQNRATEHEHSDRVPYKQWAEGGWCTLTPGSVTDNRYIEQWTYARKGENDWTVEEVDYDGHNATDMALRMREENGEEWVVEIPQTCASLNLATKRLRELIIEGRIVYDGSPLLEWCFANAIEVMNSYGDIKLSKRHKDDSQRIDLVAAVINALARLLVKIDAGQDLNDKILSGKWSM